MGSRDEMIFPSTYCYVKDKFCRVGVCKKDGKCEECEHGLLRAYAARDSDNMGTLFDEAQSLRKKVDAYKKKIAAYEKKIMQLTETVKSQKEMEAVMKEAQRGFFKDMMGGFDV